jgi:hypothetical protein
MHLINALKVLYKASRAVSIAIIIASTISIISYSYYTKLAALSRRNNCVLRLQL